jgi:hypothetical protein
VSPPSARTSSSDPSAYQRLREHLAYLEISAAAEHLADELDRGTREQASVTPTYSSWINQVERWFGELTRKQLQRGVHRSTRQLEDAIRLYLKTYNENPRPFTWVKTADEILASIQRYCLRISGTGH